MGKKFCIGFMHVECFLDGAKFSLSHRVDGVHCLSLIREN